MPSDANSPVRRRGAWWVLSTSVCAAALLWWCATLVGIAGEIRQGWQLDRIARESQQFAKLPRVTPAELRSFVARQLHQQGIECQRFEIDWQGHGVAGGAPLRITIDR